MYEDINNFNTKTDINFNEITVFIEELRKISKEKGFGEVSFEIDTSDGLEEKVFNIVKPNDKPVREIINLWDEIVGYMGEYSKNNNLWDLFNESYILLV